ncbi:hypothetical protein B0H65DRAFT_461347, partial [Neurospora tetraspora]
FWFLLLVSAFGFWFWLFWRLTIEDECFGFCFWFLLLGFGFLPFLAFDYRGWDFAFCLCLLACGFWV